MVRTLVPHWGGATTGDVHDKWSHGSDCSDWWTWAWPILPGWVWLWWMTWASASTVFFKTGPQSWASPRKVWSQPEHGLQTSRIAVTRRCHFLQQLNAARANVNVCFQSGVVGTGGFLLIIIQHLKPSHSFCAQSETFTRLSTEPFNPGDSCHSLCDSDTSATSQLVSQIRR